VLLFYVKAQNLSQTWEFKHHNNQQLNHFNSLFQIFIPWYQRFLHIFGGYFCAGHYHSVIRHLCT